MLKVWPAASQHRVPSPGRCRHHRALEVEALIQGGGAFGCATVSPFFDLPDQVRGRPAKTGDFPLCAQGTTPRPGGACNGMIDERGRPAVGFASVRSGLQLPDELCPAVKYWQQFVRILWRKRRNHAGHTQVPKPL